MKFHHIGIATNDIEKSILSIKKYFKVKEVSEIVYDANQDANLCMITLNDGIRFELINGRVVENILKKRQYLYHTCYTVDNIEKAIQDLKNDGAFLISEPKEAILFGNNKVAFLMFNLGLIELLSSGGGGYHLNLMFIFYYTLNSINYLILKIGYMKVRIWYE